MTVGGYARSRGIEPHQQAARRNGQLGRRLVAGGNRVQARVRRDIRREAVMYRVLSLGTGILGGALASALVSRLWSQFSDRNELPDPTALDLHLREALIAGAVQGVVFGVVKTALARGTSKSYRRLTGSDLKP
ncbi:MAG: DUF4235 domain-containing protein [Pseudonocardiaceae bacterium]